MFQPRNTTSSNPHKQTRDDDTAVVRTHLARHPRGTVWPSPSCSRLSLLLSFPPRQRADEPADTTPVGASLTSCQSLLSHVSYLCSNTVLVGWGGGDNIKAVELSRHLSFSPHEKRRTSMWLCVPHRTSVVHLTCGSVGARGPYFGVLIQHTHTFSKLHFVGVVVPNTQPQKLGGELTPVAAWFWFSGIRWQ